MSASMPCLVTSCRNVTRDASGRCHHHRGLSPVPTEATRHRGDLRFPVVSKPAPLVLPAPAKVEVEHESYRDLYGEKRHSVRYHRRDGVTHSEGGPALIEYGPEGEMTKAEYVFQGDHFASAAEVTAQFAKRYRFLRSLGAYSHNPNVTESVRYVASSSFRIFLEEGRPLEQIVEIFEAGVHTADGMRQVFDGAPAEWVIAFEDGASA